MTKIKTTHVGSLPRAQNVVDFIFARENETAFNQSNFDACMTSAVSETVRKQVEAGIDIVSDGETSKISYATYVKDRYTGFSGDSPRNAPGDLKLFPSFLERLANAGGTPQYALLILGNLSDTKYHHGGSHLTASRWLISTS